MRVTLEVHEFAGNMGETLTLLPVLDAFRERHAVTQVVVGADAGMLSAANLNKLEDAGFVFIVGSHTSSAPYDLAEHYATVGNIVIVGETVETTRIMGARAAARERQVVWQYSHKRKKRDNITLNKQILTVTATVGEVVAAYHDLFQVEASSRKAKTDLRARPMFASTEESIHAHLTNRCSFHPLFTDIPYDPLSRDAHPG